MRIRAEVPLTELVTKRLHPFGGLEARRLDGQNAREFVRAEGLEKRNSCLL